MITVKENDPRLAADLANAYLAALHKLSDRIAFTEAGSNASFLRTAIGEGKGYAGGR